MTVCALAVLVCFGKFNTALEFGLRGRVGLRGIGNQKSLLMTVLIPLYEF